MKKSLLSFLMVMLCVAFLPKGTIAQDLPGGSSGGYVDPADPGIADGGINGSVYIAPPSNISNVKRNNGNGTTIGLAEARLSFKGEIGDIKLVDITYMSDNTCVAGAVCSATNFGAEINFAQKYISYPLGKNVNPAKKLIFHFQDANGARFAIPETN